MSDFTLKRHDTSPAIEYELQDGDGNPVDLTGFNEVKFFMRLAGSSTLAVDADTGSNVSVTDVSGGVVRYDWNPSDTEAAGVFRAEWEVEYSDGTTETFPNKGYISVAINEDLDE